MSTDREGKDKELMSYTAPISAVDRLRITFEGKYTIVQDCEGRSRALRYGEEWPARDLVGDQMVLSLAQELEIARAAARPAPVAEPVAWQSRRNMYADWAFFSTRKEACDHCDGVADVRPLYAAPIDLDAVRAEVAEQAARMLETERLDSIPAAAARIRALAVRQKEEGRSS